MPNTKKEEKKYELKKQFNPEHYSKKAIALREDIFYHSAVLNGQIMQFWKCYPKDEDGLISRAEYIRAHGLMAKVLNPSFNKATATNLAIEDWRRDRFNNNNAPTALPREGELFKLTAESQKWLKKARRKAKKIDQALRNEDKKVNSDSAAPASPQSAANTMESRRQPSGLNYSRWNESFSLSASP
jgi:hypothetical protein